jgi:hypothetical protein
MNEYRKDEFGNFYTSCGNLGRRLFMMVTIDSEYSTKTITSTVHRITSDFNQLSKQTNKLRTALSNTECKVVILEITKWDVEVINRCMDITGYIANVAKLLGLYDEKLPDLNSYFCRRIHLDGHGHPVLLEDDDMIKFSERLSIKFYQNGFEIIGVDTVFIAFQSIASIESVTIFHPNNDNCIKRAKFYIWLNNGYSETFLGNISSIPYEMKVDKKDLKGIGRFLPWKRKKVNPDFEKFRDCDEYQILDVDILNSVRRTIIDKFNQWKSDPLDQNR